MLCHKIKRASTIAWCPNEHNKSLFISGTIEGIIDDDFRSYSKMEIFNSKQPPQPKGFSPLVTVNASEGFKAFSWSRAAPGEDLVAGSMNNGCIAIWKPSDLLLQSENEKCVKNGGIDAKPIGNVSNLDFVATSIEFGADHLLAASASSKNVINLFSVDDFYSSGENSQNYRTLSPKFGCGVAAVRWNNKVPHILASGDIKGTTCIWDLRQSKTVISIKSKNSANQGISDLSWHPSKALQIATSYSGPSPEIWDLRNAMAPSVVLSGFHKGDVNSIDWNLFDSNMILTTDSEGQSCFWGSNGKLHSSFVNQEGPYFISRWSPAMPAYFLTCSNSGYIIVKAALESGGLYAPNWCGRPSGCSFGFGDRLLSFGGSEDKTSLRLDIVEQKGEIKKKANDFKTVLEQGKMVDYCQKMINESEKEEEKTIWRLISILFETDSKIHFLKEIGFGQKIKNDLSKINENFNKNNAKNGQNDQNNEKIDENLDLKSGKIDQNNQNFDKNIEKNDQNSENKGQNDELDDISFFDKIAALSSNDENIAEKQNEEISDLKESEIVTNDNKNGKIDQIDQKCGDFDENGSKIDKIEENGENFKIENLSDTSKALIFGDFETAANSALNNGNFADALIISSCVPELWRKIQNRYLTEHKDLFMRDLFYFVINGKMDDLVKNCNLSNWKKILALILNYAKGEEKTNLCNILGQRLEKEQINSRSLLCYMCALNIKKISEMLFSVENGDLETIQNSVEKVLLCAIAILEKGKKCDEIENVLLSYVKILFAQGSVELASSYILFFFDDIQKIQNEELLKFAEAIVSPSNSSPQKPAVQKIKNISNNEKIVKPPQKISKPQELKQQLNPQLKPQLKPQLRSQLKPQPKTSSKAALPRAFLPNKNHSANLVNSVNTQKMPKIHPKARVEISSQNENKAQNQSLRPAPIQQKIPQMPSRMSSEVLYEKPPENSLNNEKFNPNYVKNGQNSSNFAKIEQNSSNFGKIDQNASNIVKNAPKPKMNHIGQPIFKNKPKIESLPIKTSPKSAEKTAKPKIDQNRTNFEEKQSIIAEGEDEEFPSKNIYCSLLNVLSIIESKKLSAMEKRKLNDALLKLKNLKESFIAEKLSKSSLNDLTQLTKELEKKNFVAAKERHVRLIASDWEEGKEWLNGINSLIMLSKRHY